MANIVAASAALRVRSAQNRAICSINGVDPNMTANNAVGFVEGIQDMYNRGPVSASIHTVSNIEMSDNQA